MKQYRNIFAEKSNDELHLLYEQYLDWKETGFISDDSKEFGAIRDEYQEFYESHVLPIVETDFLSAVASRWYQSRVKG